MTALANPVIAEGTAALLDGIVKASGTSGGAIEGWETRKEGTFCPRCKKTVDMKKTHCWSCGHHFDPKREQELSENEEEIKRWQEDHKRSMMAGAGPELKLADASASDAVRAAGTSEGAKLGWEHRQRDPNGFALPMPGDKVHTHTVGLFGMSYKIEGEVTPSGKHVLVTNGPTNRKRVGIDQARWRVTDDPNIDVVHNRVMKEDAEKHSAKLAEEAKGDAWTKDATERSVQSAIAQGHKEFQPAELAEGQHVTLHQPPYDYGVEADVVPVVVNSAHEKYPDVRRVSDLNETPWTFGNARITGAPTDKRQAIASERDHLETDPIYNKANEDFKKVSHEHDEVVRKYRAREVGDKEFLASAARMKEAHAAWDKAFDATLKTSDEAGHNSVKATDGTVLDFSSLAHAAASIQVAHWAADTVTTAHQALGKLYEDVSGLVDTLAEAYAGRTGLLPESADPGAVVAGVLDVVAKARASVPEGAEDLRNILADMEQAANKARYLLKAMDKSESNAVKADQSMQEENTIQCRAVAGTQLPVSKTEKWAAGASVSFVYAPEGVHQITAGFRKADTISICVLVDEATAPALQESFEHLTATNPKQEPYADEDHEGRKATLRFPAGATQFSWGKVRGEPGVVITGGQPTSYGAEVVNGRVYRSYSPEFASDADYSKASRTAEGHWTFPDGVRGSESNPARIVGVNFVVGALTNRPAFRAMPAVKAKHAVVVAQDTVKATWSDAARQASAEARAKGFHRGAEDMQKFADAEKDPAKKKAWEFSKDALYMSAVAHEYSGQEDNEVDHEIARLMHKQAATKHRAATNHDKAANDEIASAHEYQAKQHLEHSKSESVKSTDATASSTIQATWSDAARQASAEARRLGAASPEKASAVVKELKGEGFEGSDYRAKHLGAGHISVKTSEYYSHPNHIASVVEDWTTPGGTNAKYFQEQHGVAFKHAGTDTKESPRNGKTHTHHFTVHPIISGEGTTQAHTPSSLDSIVIKSEAVLDGVSERQARAEAVLDRVVPKPPVVPERGPAKCADDVFDDLRAAQVSKASGKDVAAVLLDGIVKGKTFSTNKKEAEILGQSA